MRCPYQTIITHIPEHKTPHGREFAQDITEFKICLREECPFYYETIVDHKKVKHCKRAEESEVKEE